MNTFIMIQARQGSKRFPNKVLNKINGIELLQIQYKRLLKVKSKKKIIFLIPKKNNKELKKFLTLNKINFFEGSEKNVLSRFFNAAKKYKARRIIRLTGDCPLVDYRLIDKLIKLFSRSKAEYASNIIQRTFAHGQDMEIFSYKALKKIKQLASSKYDMEHVTSYLTKNNKKFKIINFLNKNNEKKYRITVDYREDFNVIKQIINFYKGDLNMSSDKIIKCLKINKKISSLNNKHKIY